MGLRFWRVVWAADRILGRKFQHKIKATDECGHCGSECERRMGGLGHCSFVGKTVRNKHRRTERKLGHHQKIGVGSC